MNKLFFAVRIFLAMVFLLSGLEKLLQPYANFVYVIEGYDIIGSGWLAHAAAYVFPWAEFILGGFLLMGLWIRFVIACMGLMYASFIIVVGQAIVRKLDIVSCGCFGDLFKIPLQTIIVMDSVLLTLFLLLFLYPQYTAHNSLDRYFDRQA